MTTMTLTGTPLWTCTDGKEGKCEEEDEEEDEEEGEEKTRGLKISKS